MEQDGTRSPTSITIEAMHRNNGRKNTFERKNSNETSLHVALDIDSKKLNINKPVRIYKCLKNQFETSATCQSIKFSQCHIFLSLVASAASKSLIIVYIDC